MAEVKDNVFLKGVSGKFGDQFVFKQRNGKTFICRKPQLPAQRTPNQKKHAMRFADATAYSVEARQDPELYNYYAKIAKRKGKTAHNIAVADYFAMPSIEEIDASQYTGAAGETIIINAFKATKVAKVTVQLRDAEGALIEQGEATEALQGWLYITTTDNPQPSGTHLIARAIDLPGNIAEQEIVL
ncbi:hypothetical protein SAMN05444369_11090 [Capnocytophaga haemolytica]|uniref:Uncharacterized protein n=1 Tax=Capnocytophaga haemolytica TaxID=45243 RepID=A0AAX2GYR3_9FLAO|nr:hypothetical protein [Capnocytophaga haemolytica]AMD85381.1 hypothetical protein AXF12_07570 [Capnocytophaga haemolytica]SFO13479.1 hypothetical protein SAMN05444369_11090 [Capnocytophaga haemolytica]SNV02297.1 Uncharacterised protein [Capnocytophaga haemolytica]